jgi:tetratricopeptide (TPR) repeat protein
MRLVASAPLAVVFAAVSLLCPISGAAPGHAHAQAQPAQSEEDATRLRLSAAYGANPTPSNACSLAEAERRAGMVEVAARRLDALLEAFRVAPPPEDDETRATLSACRFNRARIYEELGDLRAAYRLLSEALATPNAARRRIVEQRLVDIGAGLVTANGCSALPSRYSAEALLRLADNAVLRRCVTARRRTSPYCEPIATREIPDTAGRYGVRRPDPNTEVFEEDQVLVVIVSGAPRTVAFDCPLAGEEEQLGLVRYHDLGRVRVLEVSTHSRVSYACDDCEEGEDCRCFDDSETRYFFGARGELLLALIPAGVDAGSMAAWPHDAPELRDTTEAATTVDGSVLVVNGRRLRIVRGALVPAP